MNIINKVKRMLSKNALVGVVAAAVLGLAAISALPAGAANVTLNDTKDCDANAVIYCGSMSTGELISEYNNGTSRNTAKSIHDIYTYFGISSAEVQAMPTNAVAGRVTKSGQVFVNSSTKAVATNALTAGRQNISGSQAVTSGTTSFYTRAPGVSFQKDSLQAFVVMKNGVFQFAVIASCGNPVKANPVLPPPAPKPVPKPQPKPQPVTKPAYDIAKTVAVKGSTAFQKDVTVKSGTRVVYRIKINSTGTAPVTNLFVLDALPAHVTYVPGTLTRDNVAFSSANAAKFFGSGITVGTLANGTSTTFQFEGVVGTADTAGKCVAEKLTNTGKMIATTLPGQTSTANVNKLCVAPPICEALDISTSANRTVKVTNFDFSTKDAKFVSAVVSWGDASKTPAITDDSNVIGQTHQYAADGTYTIAVVATFTLNGQTITSTSAKCQKKVTFSTAPPVIVPVVEEEVPPTLAAPVELAKTGPGAMVALFGGASATSAVAYNWVLRRRMGGNA